jgi:hypothetical protein
MIYYLASLAGGAVVCLFSITLTLLAHVIRHWEDR